MTYDFKAWLETKPDNEEYDFMNCQGLCAMGQYMSEVLHEPWDISRYSKLVQEQLGSAQPLSSSRTFGELKAKVLEPA